MSVFAIGRSRDHEINDIVERYRNRCPWDISLDELTVRNALSGPKLKQAEGELLIRALADDDVIVALDEHGRNLSSTDFAEQIQDWQNQSRQRLSILIGGADGLESNLTQRAHLVLALGRMTWPHLLVRVMIMEQLYRASMILAGHPYHRE